MMSSPLRCRTCLSSQDREGKSDQISSRAANPPRLALAGLPALRSTMVGLHFPASAKPTPPPRPRGTIQSQSPQTRCPSPMASNPQAVNEPPRLMVPPGLLMCTSLLIRWSCRWRQRWLGPQQNHPLPLAHRQNHQTDLCSPARSRWDRISGLHRVPAQGAFPGCFPIPKLLSVGQITGYRKGGVP